MVLDVFFSKVKTYGYQGFLYYPHLTNQSPTNCEIKAKVVPHKILVTGKIIKKKRSEFCKKISMISTPSIAKQYFFKKIIKKYDYKFTLALCGIKAIDEKLISWVLFALQKEKNLKVFIKPHPALPLNKISNFKINNQIIITHEKPDVLLKKTEILISSGPTSIVFESIIYGCQLLYLFLDPCDEIMFAKTPILKNKYKIIYDKIQLLKYIKKFKKKRFLKKNNNLRNYFYTKMTKKNIKIFY